MFILADIQRDVIVIDWILHQPVPTRVAISQIGLPQKLSIRNINEVVGYRNADLHRVNFVPPLVLVRPPVARADVLAGGGDPVAAGRILLERNAAKPRGRLRAS